MTLWIDGDACPKAIKDIIFRTAIRTRTNCILVANHAVAIPQNPFIKRIQVPKGFDVADDYIGNHIQALDIVITADIPLADIIVTKGAYALNPRGTLYTKDTIKSALSIRNLNDVLRSCQMISGGAPAISAREVRDFANNLDKYLNSRKI